MQLDRMSVAGVCKYECHTTDRVSVTGVCKYVCHKAVRQNECRRGV